MKFMETGGQYYTTARFAMHAQCMPVCGNLFHHAVEMLLKGGLAQKGETARWFSEVSVPAAGVLADSSSTKF
jgi:hypothetical protein